MYAVLITDSSIGLEVLSRGTTLEVVGGLSATSETFSFYYQLQLMALPVDSSIFFSSREVASKCAILIQRLFADHPLPMVIDQSLSTEELNAILIKVSAIIAEHSKAKALYTEMCKKADELRAFGADNRLEVSITWKEV